ncbi:DNA-binding XRE family transcriptional regulator [Streptomyces sp. 2333.5]|uniref:helix-turn-helix transcriptional regulator n=1 Tax=unclassified Streptomyces TaxID=2593676 RepID=UPI0008985F03|nr:MULTISPECIES: helix-turn-helix transcriptional regulator [unclassified Streptomyces]PJJ02536.1 DNA-binding XRE family transcriptional regulator [Streptomyces sp. 2333.5]SED14618.1 DNA-binding transcriptional regulator, XRE-family HTH domain [Streptomyces sp. 2314.4]SEE02112.1 DNA-binding transcriptional regulator, XRE-family HTH domain [Streptomyces sp. 2112.2]
MSTGLADNVRKYRRTAGLSQEALAEAADLSLSTVRKVEQGGDARVETLHALARALGVSTSALFVTEAAKPVLGDEANRRYLAGLRRALMPPIGLAAPLTDHGEAGELSVMRREMEDGHALYHADRYSSVAKKLPGLLRSTEAAVCALEGEERQHAVILRAQALMLAGKYLTQVRQYDMAYHALSEGIRLAREAGNTQLAATGVVGMCWLLLRQDRFDESEQLATLTASELEPRFSVATPGALAVWGELSLRVASAAVRNNRPDTAREARRMAATAASALDAEHIDYRSHWTTFGPVTAELKAVEDLSIVGDARGVLRRADDGLLSQKAVRNYGKPSANNWDRHRLDVARAHGLLGAHQDAMDVLTSIRRTSGEWIRHQAMARYVMSDILRSRKRTLTQDMRELAAHLGVAE